uniref:Uncharacterized protein n=1 Tax=Brassica campestris TaxID=3711 RepID=A0A3P5Y188_BRACM|nr:unnamed protein product [Brassica rapa]
MRHHQSRIKQKKISRILLNLLLELVSTDVLKMQPITLKTEHLQTSAIDFSETNEVEVSRLLAHFQIGMRG